MAWRDPPRRDERVAAWRPMLQSRDSVFIHNLQPTLSREVWRAERQSWKCDLALGVVQLELFSFPDPPPRPPRLEACGLRHLAFSVAALQPVIERLTAAGVMVEPVRLDEHTGKRFTFFADPDGLPLELYQS